MVDHDEPVADGIPTMDAPVALDKVLYDGAKVRRATWPSEVWIYFNGHSLCVHDERVRGQDHSWFKKKTSKFRQEPREVPLYCWPEFSAYDLNCTDWVEVAT
jgi:hypothetical protein